MVPKGAETQSTHICCTSPARLREEGEACRAALLGTRMGEGSLGEVGVLGKHFMPLSGLCRHHRKSAEGKSARSLLKNSYPGLADKPGPALEVLGASPEVRTYRREALSCMTGRQRGPEGLSLVPASCRAEPSAANSQGRQGPAGVIRLEAGHIAVHPGLLSPPHPPAWTPSLPGQPLASFLSLLRSHLAGGAGPDLLG